MLDLMTTAHLRLILRHAAAALGALCMLAMPPPDAAAQVPVCGTPPMNYVNRIGDNLGDCILENECRNLYGIAVPGANECRAPSSPADCAALTNNPPPGSSVIGPVLMESASGAERCIQASACAPQFPSPGSAGRLLMLADGLCREPSSAADCQGLMSPGLSRAEVRRLGEMNVGQVYDPEGSGFARCISAEACAGGVPARRQVIDGMCISPSSPADCAAASAQNPGVGPLLFGGLCIGEERCAELGRVARNGRCEEPESYEDCARLSALSDDPSAGPIYRPSSRAINGGFFFVDIESPGRCTLPTGDEDCLEMSLRGGQAAPIYSAPLSGIRRIGDSNVLVIPGACRAARSDADCELHHPTHPKLADDGRSCRRMLPRECSPQLALPADSQATSHCATPDGCLLLGYVPDESREQCRRPRSHGECLRMLDAHGANGGEYYDGFACRQPRNAEECRESSAATGRGMPLFNNNHRGESVCQPLQSPPGSAEAEQECMAEFGEEFSALRGECVPAAVRTIALGCPQGYRSSPDERFGNGGCFSVEQCLDAYLLPRDDGSCSSPTSDEECASLVSELGTNSPAYAGVIHVSGGTPPCRHPVNNAECRSAYPARPIYEADDMSQNCRAATNDEECAREHGPRFAREAGGRCVQLESSCAAAGDDGVPLAENPSECAENEAACVAMTRVVSEGLCRPPAAHFECAEIDSTRPILNLRGEGADRCVPAATDADCEINHPGTEREPDGSCMRTPAGMCIETDETTPISDGSGGCRGAMNSNECRMYYPLLPIRDGSGRCMPASDHAACQAEFSDMPIRGLDGRCRAAADHFECRAAFEDMPIWENGACRMAMTEEDCPDAFGPAAPMMANGSCVAASNASDLIDEADCREEGLIFDEGIPYFSPDKCRPARNVEECRNMGTSPQYHHQSVIENGRCVFTCASGFVGDEGTCRLTQKACSRYGQVLHWDPGPGEDIDVLENGVPVSPPSCRDPRSVLECSLLLGENYNSIEDGVCVTSCSRNLVPNGQNGLYSVAGVAQGECRERVEQDCPVGHVLTGDVNGVCRVPVAAAECRSRLGPDYVMENGLCVRSCAPGRVPDSTGVCGPPATAQACRLANPFLPVIAGGNLCVAAANATACQNADPRFPILSNRGTCEAATSDEECAGAFPALPLAAADGSCQALAAPENAADCRELNPLTPVFQSVPGTCAALPPDGATDADTACYDADPTHPARTREGGCAPATSDADCRTANPTTPILGRDGVCVVASGHRACFKAFGNDAPAMQADGSCGLRSNAAAGSNPCGQFVLDGEACRSPNSAAECAGKTQIRTSRVPGGGVQTYAVSFDKIFGGQCVEQCPQGFSATPGEECAPQGGGSLALSPADCAQGLVLRGGECEKPANVDECLQANDVTEADFCVTRLSGADAEKDCDAARQARSSQPYQAIEDGFCVTDCPSEKVIGSDGVCRPLQMGDCRLQGLTLINGRCANPLSLAELSPVTVTLPGSELARPLEEFTPTATLTAIVTLSTGLDLTLVLTTGVTQTVATVTTGIRTPIYRVIENGVGATSCSIGRVAGANGVCRDRTPEDCAASGQVLSDDGSCRAPLNFAECLDAGFAGISGGLCAQSCESDEIVDSASGVCRAMSAEDCATEGQILSAGGGACEDPSHPWQCMSIAGAGFAGIENGMCVRECSLGRALAAGRCRALGPDDCNDEGLVADGSQCRSPSAIGECTALSLGAVIENGRCDDECDAGRLAGADGLCRAPASDDDCNEVFGRLRPEYSPPQAFERFINGRVFHASREGRCRARNAQTDCEQGQVVDNLTGECRSPRSTMECLDAGWAEPSFQIISGITIRFISTVALNPALSFRSRINRGLVSSDVNDARCVRHCDPNEAPNRRGVCGPSSQSIDDAAAYTMEECAEVGLILVGSGESVTSSTGVTVVHEGDCRRPANISECTSANSNFAVIQSGLCAEECDPGSVSVPGGMVCRPLSQEQDCTPAGEILEAENSPFAACRPPANARECANVPGAGLSVIDEGVCKTACDGSRTADAAGVCRMLSSEEECAARDMVLSADGECRAPLSAEECASLGMVLSNNGTCRAPTAINECAGGLGAVIEDGRCAAECDPGHVPGSVGANAEGVCRPLMNADCATETTGMVLRNAGMPDASCDGPGSVAECEMASPNLSVIEDGLCAESCAPGRLRNAADGVCRLPRSQPECIIATEGRFRHFDMRVTVRSPGMLQGVEEGSMLGVVEVIDLASPNYSEVTGCRNMHQSECTEGEVLKPVGEEGDMACQRPDHILDCQMANESHSAAGFEVIEGGLCAQACNNNRIGPDIEGSVCRDRVQTDCTPTGQILTNNVDGVCRNPNDIDECGPLNANFTVIEGGVCSEACSGNRVAREGSVCADRVQTDCTPTGQILSSSLNGECRNPMDFSECETLNMEETPDPNFSVIDDGVCATECSGVRITVPDTQECRDKEQSDCTPMGQVLEGSGADADCVDPSNIEDCLGATAIDPDADFMVINNGICAPECTTSGDIPGLNGVCVSECGDDSILNEEGTACRHRVQTDCTPMGQILSAEDRGVCRNPSAFSECETVNMIEMPSPGFIAVEGGVCAQACNDNRIPNASDMVCRDRVQTDCTPTGQILSAEVDGVCRNPNTFSECEMVNMEEMPSPGFIAIEGGICARVCNDNRIPETDPNAQDMPDMACRDRVQADCTQNGLILSDMTNGICREPVDIDECTDLVGAGFTVIDGISCSEMCGDNRIPNEPDMVCRDRTQEDCTATSEILTADVDGECRDPESDADCVILNMMYFDPGDGQCSDDCPTDRSTPGMCEDLTQAICSEIGQILEDSGSADARTCRNPENIAECEMVNMEETPSPGFTAIEGDICVQVCNGNRIRNEPDMVCRDRVQADCTMESRILSDPVDGVCRNPANIGECTGLGGAGFTVIDENICAEMCGDNRIPDASDMVCRNRVQSDCTPTSQIVSDPVDGVCRSPANVGECTNVMGAGFTVIDENICAEMCGDNRIPNDSDMVCRNRVQSDCTPDGQILSASTDGICRDPTDAADCEATPGANYEVIDGERCAAECGGNRIAPDGPVCRDRVQDDCTPTDQILSAELNGVCRAPVGIVECENVMNRDYAVIERGLCAAECDGNRIPNDGSMICRDRLQSDCTPDGRILSDPADGVCRSPDDVSECENLDVGYEVIETDVCAIACNSDRVADSAGVCQNPQTCDDQSVIADTEVCLTSSRECRIDNAAAPILRDGACDAAADSAECFAAFGENGPARYPNGSCGPRRQSDCTPRILNDDGMCRSPAAITECEGLGASFAVIDGESCAVACGDERVPNEEDMVCRDRIQSDCTPDGQILSDPSNGVCRNPNAIAECESLDAGFAVIDVGVCTMACADERIAPEEEESRVCRDRMQSDCTPEGLVLSAPVSGVCREPASIAECETANGADPAASFAVIENSICMASCSDDTRLAGEGGVCRPRSQADCTNLGQFFENGFCRSATSAQECRTARPGMYQYFDDVAESCVSSCPAMRPDPSPGDPATNRAAGICGTACASGGHEAGDGACTACPTHSVNSNVSPSSGEACACPEGEEVHQTSSLGLCAPPLQSPGTGRSYSSNECEQQGWAWGLVQLSEDGRLLAEVCYIPTVIAGDVTLTTPPGPTAQQLDEGDQSGACVLRENSEGSSLYPPCNAPRLFGNGGLPQRPSGIAVSATTVTITVSGMERIETRVSVSGGHIEVSPVVRNGSPVEPILTPRLSIVPPPAVASGSSGGNTGPALIALPVAALLVYAIISDEAWMSPTAGYRVEGGEEEWTYGGRVEYRGKNWRSHVAASSESDEDGMTYESGGRYDGEFWAASYESRETEEIRKYDFSLSTEWISGAWEIRPNGAAGFEFDTEEDVIDSSATLGFEMLWKPIKWQVRKNAELAWDSDEGQSVSRVRLAVEREF